MSPEPLSPLAPGLAALELPEFAPFLIIGDWEPPIPVVEADRAIALELERRETLRAALARRRAELDLGPGDGWNPYPHEGAEEAVAPRSLEAGIEHAGEEVASLLRRSGRLPVTFGEDEAADPVLLDHLARSAEPILALIRRSGRAEDFREIPEGLNAARSFCLDRVRLFGDRAVLQVAALAAEHFEVTIRAGAPPVLASGLEEESPLPLSRRWSSDAPSRGPAVDLYEDLVSAAMGGGTDRVRALIAAGADPDLAEGDAPTPLAEAAKWPEPATVRALLELGADPFRRSHGRTPLGLAREQFAALSWVWSPAGDFAREMARLWEGEGEVDLYQPECSRAFEAIIHLLEDRIGLSRTPFV